MRLRREQLLQMVSAEVADRILDSEEDLLAGRRLEVSVLSCDVVSFRPLAEQRPADSLVALSRILRQLAPTVLAHQGTLMSFPGDGLLAVFGAPLSVPDHRLLAERAKAEIGGPALRAANAELATLGIDPLELQIAIASGPATVGVIGAEPRWEYVAIGEPTSQAVAATSDG